MTKKSVADQSLEDIKVAQEELQKGRSSIADFLMARAQVFATLAVAEAFNRLDPRNAIDYAASTIRDSQHKFVWSCQGCYAYNGVNLPHCGNCGLKRGDV